MKQLRAIRILLATLFFVASVACLAIGPQIHPMAAAAERIQLTFTASAVTIGVTLVWLLITFLFGRVYCATVCPIGSLSDIFLRIRRKIPRLNKPFSYRHRSRCAIPILWIYIICGIVGIVIALYIIEPWNMARNITSVVNPDTTLHTWQSLGIGVGAGIAAGLITLLLIALTSLWRGREFCSRYCPVGTALGAVSALSLYHIEIDPDKCTNCGICEDHCRSQCIKVISRYVDNTRCVRCLDCTANCPNDAIRFQINRNRPASPLMRRSRQLK